MILNGEAKLKTIMDNDGTQANTKKAKENDKKEGQLRPVGGLVLEHDDQASC